MATQHEQFTNPSFLQKLAMDLIRSRKSNYVQDCMYYYYQESKFIMEQLYDVKNKYNNALKCTLVKHRLSLLQKVQQDFVLSHNSKKSQQKVEEKCIIYLHGLGSNRIEGFTILPHMPKSYCLVSFDLSGSGKSEGEWTTYGWREREDVQSVMAYLYQKKGMRQFVVWGRSMGAVAALLFNNMMGQFKQGKHQQADIDKETLQKEETQVEGIGKKPFVQLGTLYDCVKCIVADSPFCSFESISKDIALKKMSIPTFFTQIALKFLQNTFSKLLYDNKVKQTFTPFQIDFEKNPLKPCVPTIFVYSLNDEVVGCEHSQKIISSIDRQKFKMIDKVIIPQCGHNLKRPENVMEVIFQKVQRNLAIGKRDGRVNSNSEKTNDKQKILEKSGKAVRKKSFWNFEEDLLQLQKNIDKQKQNERQDKNHQSGENCQQNKFSAQINNEKSTVRRSIFARDQKCTNESKISKKADGKELVDQKRGSSITRKRGLSLSSTIERMEGSTRMNTQSNLINSKQVDGSIPKHNNPSHILQLDQASMNNSLVNRQSEKENTKTVQRSRNLSMDVRKSTRQEQEQQSRMSPRKGINRCSLKLMNKNFEDSSRKRPSLGGVRNSSCNRVVLGGEKAKGTLDRVSKMMGTSLCSQSFIPAEKDSNRENQFSTISYSSQSIHQTNTLISRQMPRSQPCIIDSLLSEPNMGPTQVLDQRGYKKCSSRQSLKTIDIGQMHGKNSVDEQLQAFINNKLQFNFDKRNWDQGVFNKYKTIDFGNAENQIIQVKGNNNRTINDSERSSVTRKSIELGGSPGKRRMQSRNKTKQSIILSQIDPKQFTQFNELNQEQIAKVSKLSIPSHITLRPSSRLYHEKRKKKLQGQVNSFNRQNENFVKITNQRYLAED